MFCIKKIPHISGLVLFPSILLQGQLHLFAGLPNDSLESPWFPAALKTQLQKKFSHSMDDSVLCWIRQDDTIYRAS